MATQTLTRAAALAQAIDLAQAADRRDLAEKLAQMLAVETKPRAKSTTPTAQQVKNANLAREVAAFVWSLDTIEGVSSRAIVDGMANPEVRSTQKCVSLLKAAAAQGWLERLEVKSQVLWVRGTVRP